MKDIPKEIREEVLERDSVEGCPCCINCGKPMLQGMHLHHVKRRSQGGEHKVNNLVSLCPQCHMALHNGNKEIEEWCKAYIQVRSKK